ncbi:MAG: hypothetical protein AAFU64_03970 [Bacteroidota bacterium]
MRNYLSVLLLFLITFSCDTSIQREADLYQWINQEENGLIKSKRINGLELIVKYLPASYLVLKELKSIPLPSAEAIDSLEAQYEGNYTFLLTIKPIQSQGQEDDVMYREVASLAEYKQRAMQMNFGMEERVELHIGESTLKPCLTSLENSYGLSTHRSIYMVFVEDEKSSVSEKKGALDFRFEDDIFATGINHFVFKKSDLNNIPPINYHKIISTTNN